MNSIRCDVGVWEVLNGAVVVPYLGFWTIDLKESKSTIGTLHEATNPRFVALDKSICKNK